MVVVDVVLELPSVEVVVLGTVPDVVTLHPTFVVLGKVLCSVVLKVELD
jgi:hypothetical protein